MAYFDREKREIWVRIAYCGPASSGKTTNLQSLYDHTPIEERTDWHDVHGVPSVCVRYPMEIIEAIHAMDIIDTKLQLFVLQPDMEESLRKKVLQTVDGVIFVADSRKSQLRKNFAALQKLEQELDLYGEDILDILKVIQWNKRDLKDACEIEELQRAINYYGFYSTLANATTAYGVFDTMKMCLKRLYGKIMNEVRRDIRDQQQGKTLQQIDQQTRYEGCTFHLENKVRFENGEFHNCSFYGNKAQIAFFGRCELTNCDFSGDYEVNFRQERLLCAPPWMFDATFLNSMVLSHNRIRDIPIEIGRLRNLTHLDLSKNFLCHLPASIKRLQNLQFMNLTENSIDKQHKNWLTSQLPNCEIHF
ncbi:GTPase domain-containing protein [Candidatus Uabimicrobium amorphum]|uniref:Cell polarity determinant GTPase MglA n=1 Tax=Uabimicrobium amorphum TaxID=2596890 RepID=A0A5S9F4T2_UABAM|nr:GTPase domain-containing protein [Candidatus Uabimicrobium amorphum]BBM86106.1 cell polarity determinant GTPase MglA [Candidatus Uabimicrobium amorphum]